MTDTKLVKRAESPKLSLFAFHIYRELTRNVAPDAGHLWQQLANLGTKLKIADLEKLPELLRQNNSNTNGFLSEAEQPAVFIELLPERALSFPAIPQQGQPDLSGEIYPVQLHDTYAADLTLRYEDTTVEVSQISGLNPQGCLLPSNIQASLGQTLLLFAKPADNLDNRQEFAEACLEALLSNSGIDKKQLSWNAGQLLGSPIFEWKNYRQDPRLQCHILIWLNCHPQTATLEAEGKYYHPLFNLLCCRSKILFAYHEACRCYEAARRLYEQLEKKGEALNTLREERPERLKQLKEWLTEMPKASLEYACYQRDIKAQLTAIYTNTKNYKTSLKNIRKYTLPSDNLDFLQDFLDSECNQFQEQIKVDLDYLAPGGKLFQEMIEIMRGIVEIEGQEQQQEDEEVQRKRDQNLQNTIFFFGTAISAAGVVASSYPLLKEQPLLPPWDENAKSIHPFTGSLIISLVAGLLAGGLVMGLMYGVPKLIKRVRGDKDKGKKALNPATGNPINLESPAKVPVAEKTGGGASD
jgi:hypothetical protein